MSAGTFTSGYSDRQAAEALRADPGQYQTSPDPWEATHETILYMCGLVRDSLGDGIVQAATQQARQYFRLAGRSAAGAIWQYAKLRVKFVHHARLLGDWIGMPDELQLLIRPDALLKMSEPKGDCAVFTTLVCAMLSCARVPWEIVTVAVDPRQPGVFSHVYPRAVLPNGARLPLDASHGKYPGWEVPRSRVTGKQVWDESGNPIDDQDSGFRGLHGVPMPMYGLGGCGDCLDYQYDADGNPTDVCSDFDTTGCVATTSPIYTELPTTYPGWGNQTTVSTSPTSPSYPSSTVTPTVGSSNPFAALTTQLGVLFGAQAGVATKLVQNADGSWSLVSAPAGSTTASSLFGSSLSSANLSNLLLIGGVLVGGFFLVSMIGKR